MDMQIKTQRSCPELPQEEGVEGRFNARFTGSLTSEPDHAGRRKKSTKSKTLSQNIKQR